MASASSDQPPERAEPGGNGLRRNEPGERTPGRPSRPGTRPRTPIGRVLVASLASGFLAAALLLATPFVPPTEAGVTGGLLCGLALGWVALAALSARCTDQPQPWAVVPALFTGLGGLILLTFGPAAHRVIDWVWPPAAMVLVVWMFGRARRHLPGPSRRRLLNPVLAVLAIAALGGGYQTVREAVDARVHPMPGRSIDVGGHRLHLHCTGSGSPTVVLEPGAGATSSDLALLTPVIARDTRVCVYDRAGRGWSEPTDTPQDGARIATDLHTLLHRGGVPGPYVLAGHSFGGLYALAFAARYPDEVVGMVLVDSTAPAPSATPGPTPEASPPREWGVPALAGRVPALLSTSGHLGLGRLVDAPSASHLRSTLEEYAQANSSRQHAASLRDLADEPLIVLTAGSGSSVGWPAKQEALATLSTNSVHRVVEGVDHAGLITDGEGAAATVQAVLDVLALVRDARRLTG